MQRVNWVCSPDEWSSVGSFYDHSLGQLLKSGESSVYSFVRRFPIWSSISIGHQYILIVELIDICFISTKACPTILPVQRAFLERVFEIPFEERS